MPSPPTFLAFLQLVLFLDVLNLNHFPPWNISLDFSFQVKLYFTGGKKNQWRRNSSNAERQWLSQQELFILSPGSKLISSICICFLRLNNICLEIQFLSLRFFQSVIWNNNYEFQLLWWPRCGLHSPALHLLSQIELIKQPTFSSC